MILKHSRGWVLLLLSKNEAKNPPPSCFSATELQRIPSYVYVWIKIPLLNPGTYAVVLKKFFLEEEIRN
jgi:hypothetical protein